MQSVGLHTCTFQTVRVKYVTWCRRILYSEPFIFSIHKGNQFMILFTLSEVILSKNSDQIEVVVSTFLLSSKNMESRVCFFLTNFLYCDIHLLHKWEKCTPLRQYIFRPVNVWTWQHAYGNSGLLVKPCHEI